MPGVRGGSVASYRTPTAVYVGPGDIEPGAIGWWGLRAYAAATAGTAAVRLRRDSDNGEQDFNTLANGDLDVASISSFKGAANLFVVALYNQAGGSVPALTQATAGNQPPFILNVLGSFPAIQGAAHTNSFRLFTTWPSDISQPWCMSAFAKRTGDTSAFNTIFASAGSRDGLYFDNTATRAALYAPSGLATTQVLENAWLSFHGLASASSSVLQVSGDYVTGATGSSALTGVTAIVGDGNGIDALNGNIMEAGAWASDISSSFTDLEVNQSLYWFGPYVGPGDIVSGARAWWGLRAYSAAAAGSNAIRVRRITDDAEQDIATLANGKLDITSAVKFLGTGGSRLRVVKLYDQTGGGFDLVQSNTALQPELWFDVLPTKPSMRILGTAKLENASLSGSLSQPYTIAAVGERFAAYTTFGAALYWNGGDDGLFWHTAANTVSLWAAGANFTAAAADDVFHTLAGVANGASSSLTVDGSTTNGSLSSSVFTGTVVMGDGSSLDFAEVGIWNTAFSGTQLTNMDANQSSFWSV
jgi:hypothetical protein